MLLLLAWPTREEFRRALPGDVLVPDAAATVMHAATIHAPLECVWPWLVQMGAGRAGWYSYDWVDNDGMPSATGIIPELQHIAPGDIMPSLPGAQGLLCGSRRRTAARSYFDGSRRRRR